ncbi:putative disease resistance protein RGA1 [Oryza brachyantha]|uniref:AAA+ ATPase domain-containing protein n=1 Tax=Oryza brachyantha TaxID=4533 RepID=J3NA85_ORYBR|nr:putative disease resistance protein RGA1 [Oryza brachyantha]
MANPWRIAAMGLVVTVLGWFLSPMISLLVNKFFSSLFDASRKIQELAIHTVPKLEQMLREIEEQRMHRKAKKERSAVQHLDELAKIVKSALYEAEDILDLIDYHRIERDIVGGDDDGDDAPHAGSNWHQHIRDAIHACIDCCKNRSAELLPIHRAPSVSLEFSSCCQSVLIWSTNWFQVARDYRDYWSYEVVGITGYYQEDGVAVDSFLPSIARWKLGRRIEKLENTVADVEKSPLLNQKSSGTWNDIVNMNRRSITSSSTRKVFGRDMERDTIRSMLREGPDDSAASSSSSKCYSVICIYGIAGSGKTTLAQYVCDHEKEDKDRYFDTIMLIYISKAYRLEDIFRDMLDEITRNRHSEITDCKGLEAKLVENLRGKRFLLVLDDLWVHDENHEKLLSPLNAGKAGSRILVTTQSKEAALGSNRLIAISDLEEEQYFSMFMHYALDSTVFDDREFIPIGRKIANKLNRSPIAAVTVAGQLWRNPDIRFWQTTANLDVLNKTKGALWWSYNQLVVDVRRCFQYCSIFPRRHEMERDNLVRMWVAQGFVKDNDGHKEDVEDVGQDYFHDLYSCSFLQLKRKVTSDISSGEYFTVHDMFHELAVTIAGSDCVRIDRGIVTEHLPKHVRHLCIECYSGAEFPEQILKLANLRTLIMCNSVGGMSKDDFERVLTRLRKLRVVHLDLQDLSTVPACIGELKHLRYIGISPSLFNDITLPAEFTKLYHLHEFWFSPSIDLHFTSPARMGNLINLRYMHTWKGLDIPDIGRLTLLRNLFRFTVRKDKGYEITQLEHLNSLSFRLFIDHLENITSREEAALARLADKAHLKDLTLRWGGDDEHSTTPRATDPELEAEVLQELRPPSGITSLCIRDYSGARYPSWLSGEDDQGDLPALKYLMFWGCNGSSVPPMFGERFSLLYQLSVAGCSWSSLPDNLDCLTMLKELIVQECPNMQSLPTLPRSLTSIVVSDCNRSLEKSCQTRGHPNWQKIRHIRYKTIR